MPDPAMKGFASARVAVVGLTLGALWLVPGAGRAIAPVVGVTGVEAGPVRAPGRAIAAQAVAARGFTPAEAEQVRRTLDQALLEASPLLSRLFEHYASADHGYARLRKALDSAETPGPGAVTDVRVTSTLRLTVNLKAAVLYADRDQDPAGTAAEDWLRRKIAADVLWSLASAKDLTAALAALPDPSPELVRVKKAQEPAPPAMQGARWLSELTKELEAAAREAEVEHQHVRANPMGPPFTGWPRLNDVRAEIALRIGRELGQAAKPRMADVVRFARSLRDPGLRNEVLAELVLATPDRHWASMMKQLAPALGPKGSDLRVGVVGLDGAGKAP